MANADPNPQAAPGKPEPTGSSTMGRQEFWIETCREATQRRACTPRVLEFYQKHGCRFTAPNAQQVQDILEALDAALPAWEEQHPELFFQALELNFPELLRNA